MNKERMPKQPPAREKQEGPFKRDELAPDVRDYADSIHGQIKDFFAGYEVATDNEFQSAVREGKIPLEELEEIRAKMDELTKYFVQANYRRKLEKSRKQQNHHLIQTILIL